MHNVYNKQSEAYISNITLNKSIYHKYFVKKEFEAGILLKGWEVRSLRSGRVNINNSYVIVKNNEAFLCGVNFIPPYVISMDHLYHSRHMQKLLLKKHELSTLYGYVNRAGYTIIVVSLYWRKAWCKAKIGIAQGKKQHDKRASLKKREWQRNRERLIKNTNRSIIC